MIKLAKVQIYHILTLYISFIYKMYAIFNPVFFISVEAESSLVSYQVFRRKS